MIPNLVDLGNPTPWPVLPPGVHPATLAEVGARFATTPHRSLLFQGFVLVAGNLWGAGCLRVFLNGSFATDKPHPGDFDGCWDATGVDLTKVDPLFITAAGFVNKRAAQKAKYLGEMFIANAPAGNSSIFLDFFQQDKFSGQQKGILLVSR